ncbi:DUF423 domain-containing protein [Nitrosomonas ureae]|uniref:Uncharacterized membrane protein YgdD (TMEM256/DUF423 family) n=1 Tax=Nitrosomonas ureae TaxID=44577 RepID=A0A0S3AIG0_9PROT|nr:DUF423 domain-containing protein [Nitrosomonas ureae]ALQ50957.1 hypothetical protein ATY38_06785 [Nitrosomonas ureae]PTQ87583.1 uncharacterized membrane protein YgdD (TMEM256/DUF423 family) [Nitrosomonas ureae]PXX10680.1 uncharacterized membrane protein YgdD (TMEM256/DUF423 family) [Nitrosomonas ureae]SDT85142.1 Uncharacterized membrane protein YgdD, TMEM256/DUF423 family [Nitrosomonas ureae]SEQ23779.1 Uncharacterized membrane protein YgdD, TMEM256/DUF423 family [Nitrosomonas ureae]
MSRTFLILGILNALLCIALGAFGAHGLKRMLSADMLSVYHTGVQYHFYHAFGIIVIGLLLLHFPKSRLMPISGWLMMIGIVLFSFSLYGLSITDMRALGMITPFGGISFLTAWALLAYAIWREK